MLLTFTACIAMGVTGYLLDRKSGKNRAFALMSFIISIWAFGDFFYYNATDLESVWFWYRIASIGWCGIIFGNFYLCLEFAGYYKKVPFLIKALVFAYSLSLIVVHFNGRLFVENISITSGGPVEEINTSAPAFLFFHGGLILSIAAGAFFLIKGMIESRSTREKKMVRDFLVLLFVGYGLAAGPDFLKLHLKFPPFGPFAILIFLAGILYLMQRYRLLRVDYGLLQTEVFNIISDLVIIITPDKKTVNINDAVKSVVKYHDKSIYDYFVDNKELDGFLASVALNKVKIEKKYMQIRGKNNKNIPVHLSVCPVFDKFKDQVGFVLICRLLTDFEKIIADYKLSPQERKLLFFLKQGLINKEISGRMGISTGVVKNYIYSIYRKTHVSNRVELLRLFFPADV